MREATTAPRPVRGAPELQSSGGMLSDLLRQHDMERRAHSRGQGRLRLGLVLLGHVTLVHPHSFLGPVLSLVNAYGHSEL